MQPCMGSRNRCFFLNDVLIPLCRDGDTIDGSYRNPTQAEVCKALAESDLPIGKTKTMCSRYLRALEERNVIKREKSENDKRGMVIIPLVDELEKLSLRIEDSIEKLVNTMKKAIPGDIEVLLKQNFTVFHRGGNRPNSLPQARFLATGSLPRSPICLSNRSNRLDNRNRVPGQGASHRG